MGSPVRLFRAVSDLRILHLLLLVLLEVLCEFLGFWFQTKHSASLSLLPLAMTVCFCMTQPGRRQASLSWSPWVLFLSLFRGWGRRVSLRLSLRGPSRTSRAPGPRLLFRGAGRGHETPRLQNLQSKPTLHGRLVAVSPLRLEPWLLLRVRHPAVSRPPAPFPLLL